MVGLLTSNKILSDETEKCDLSADGEDAFALYGQDCLYIEG
mgnify:CR=1 FL=1